MGFLPQYVFKHWPKRFAAACFDSAGALLFFPARFKRRRRPSTIKRILAIRLDHLGDVLMTRPALAALRQRFPEAQIDFLIAGEFASLFEGTQEADRVIAFKNHWFSPRPSFFEALEESLNLIKQFRKNAYDLAVDFRGDLRNIALMFFSGIPARVGWGITGGGFLLNECPPRPAGLHQVELNNRLLECLGIKGQVSNAPLRYSPQRAADFSRRFENRVPQHLAKIVIQPGAGYPSKRWEEGKFKALIERILQKELGFIFLIGSEAERKLIPGLAHHSSLMDLRGQTQLDELPILFDRCDLFIGNDSGPAHLAAAQGTESIVLFSGTNDARLWRPWNKRLHLIQHQVPCSPCESRQCPLGHHDCMQKIEVDQVFEKAAEILSKKAGVSR